MSTIALWLLKNTQGLAGACESKRGPFWDINVHLETENWFIKCLMGQLNGRNPIGGSLHVCLAGIQLADSIACIW